MTKRVLIFIQALDEKDPLMGFFVTWMRAFLKEREAIVCGLRVSDPMPDFGPRAEIHRLRPTGSRSRWTVIWNVLRISWHERKRYDAVYIRSDVQYAIIAAWLWKLLGKKTVLWYCHHIAHPLFYPATLLVDHTVTPVAEGCPDPRVKPFLVGHGIDVAQFPFVQRSEQDPLRVLIFGRISRSKYIIELVDAFVRSDLGERARLTIRGPAIDPPYAEEIKKYIAAYPQVSFVPEAVPYKDIAAFFSGFDVMLNANKASLDKSILEAPLTGMIPVVATTALLEFFPPQLHWLHATTLEENVKALQRLATMSAEEKRALRTQVRDSVAQHHALSSQMNRLLPLLAPKEDGSLLGLFGWAFLTRFLVLSALLIFVGAKGLLLPDSHDYVGLAQSMLQGQGFSIDGQPFQYRTIGYPLIVAAGLAVVKSPAIFSLIQIIFAALLPLLVLRIGKQLGFSPSVRRKAAWISVFEPHLVFYSVPILTETFFTLSLLLALSYALATFQTKTVRDAAKTGLLFGVNILIKPLLQFFAPLFLGAVVVWRLTGRRVAWRALGMFLVTSCLIVSPWIYRNYRVFGSASLSSQGPAAAALYLAPSILSTQLKIGYHDAELMMEERIAAYLVQDPKAEKSALYTQEAVRVLKQYPFILARVLVVNTLSYWTSHNYAYVPHYYGLIAAPNRAYQPPTHLLIQGRFGEFFREAPKIFVQPFYLVGALGRLIWLIVSVLVLLGFFYAFRRFKDHRLAHALVFGLFLYFTMTVWVNGLGVEGRLRYPLMPLEFLYALYAISLGKDVMREFLVLMLIPVRWIMRLRHRASEATVLFYHSISDDASDPYAVSPEAFRKQLTLLSKRAQVVRLEEIVTYVEGRKTFETTQPIVAVTFDDGYADFLTHALPLLKERNMPATLFVCAKPDATELGNVSKLLSDEQHALLAHEPLIEFGSHAVTHRKLTKLSDEEVKSELDEGKRFIEKQTGKPCRFLAYPKGAFDERCVKQAKASGYAAAFTIKQGTVKAGDDVFKLKRVVVQKNISLFEFRFRLTRIIDWVTLVWKKYYGYGR